MVSTQHDVNVGFCLNNYSYQYTFQFVRALTKAVDYLLKGRGSSYNHTPANTSDWVGYISSSITACVSFTL